MRLFDVFLNLLIDGREVGERQFRVDDFDVFDGVHVTGNVNHIFVVEATDDVRNGIALADVREELVAEAFAFARAGDETGDVHKFHRSGHDALGLHDFSQGL